MRNPFNGIENIAEGIIVHNSGNSGIHSMELKVYYASLEGLVGEYVKNPFNGIESRGAGFSRRLSTISLESIQWN